MPAGRQSREGYRGKRSALHAKATAQRTPRPRGVAAPVYSLFIRGPHEGLNRHPDDRLVSFGSPPLSPLACGDALRYGFRSSVGGTLRVRAFSSAGSARCRPAVASVAEIATLTGCRIASSRSASDSQRDRFGSRQRLVRACVTSCPFSDGLAGWHAGAAAVHASAVRSTCPRVHQRVRSRPAGVQVPVPRLYQRSCFGHGTEFRAMAVAASSGGMPVQIQHPGLGTRGVGRENRGESDNAR